MRDGLWLGRCVERHCQSLQPVTQANVGYVTDMLLKTNCEPPLNMPATNNSQPGHFKLMVLLPPLALTECCLRETNRFSG